MSSVSMAVARRAGPPRRRRRCRRASSRSPSTSSISPGGLSARSSATLQRLEAKGLVDTRLGDPRAERGGKPRRLVTLRPSGVKAVRATTTAIQAMVGDLDGAIGELA